MLSARRVSLAHLKFYEFKITTDEDFNAMYFVFSEGVEFNKYSNYELVKILSNRRKDEEKTEIKKDCRLNIDNIIKNSLPGIFFQHGHMFISRRVKHNFRPVFFKNIIH